MTSRYGFPTGRMYWVGVDPPGPDPVADEVVFDELRAAEGLEDAVFTRMTLRRPDPRGDYGPRHIASFALGADVDLLDFARSQAELLAKNAASAVNPVSYRPRWRLVFERIAEAGCSEMKPSSALLIGMTPARGASREEVAGFNAFYNDVHLPEVMAAQGFPRATRYEMVHELLHPSPGCPRYLAVYEAGYRTAPGSTASGPDPEKFSYTTGPDVWLRRETAWRLRYDLA